MSLCQNREALLSPIANIVPQSYLSHAFLSVSSHPTPLNEKPTKAGNWVWFIITEASKQFWAREQSCSVNVDWIDWTTLLSWGFTGKITYEASWARGTAFSLIKGTKVKAPRKIEWLSSFGSHIVRLSTMLSFRKPTNEKRQRLLNMSGSCRYGSCECNPTAPMTVGIWAQTAKVTMETKPFVWELRLARGNSLLIQAVQEGHVSSPCLFIPSPGWNWEPKFTQMY